MKVDCQRDSTPIDEEGDIESNWVNNINENLTANRCLHSGQITPGIFIYIYMCICKYIYMNIHI
jgi:hypothetical protein